MLKYVVLIITLEVCVDIYSWRLLQFKCKLKPTYKLMQFMMQPWESRAVGRYLDVVAGWGRSLDAPLVGGNARNAGFCSVPLIGMGS